MMAAAALCALLMGAATAHAADGSATWVSAPAQPPPAPTGVPTTPYPLPVGYVGDIEFWAPNRGVLITAGNSVVPAGLYAYDGVTWHQLSTVCGGTDGRIAWAGPDDFWTISDQRQGQVLTTGGTSAFDNVSLCHFSGGQVVASYAMPLEQPNSYHPMNAAACSSPSNCWFGGQLDSSGAFHLHWDGTNLSVVDTVQDHEIASMVADRGQIFESVELQPGDDYGSESTDHPPLVHVDAPQDPGDPFHDVFMADDQDPSCGSFCPPLPDYGRDDAGNSVEPDTLGGLSLSSDWRAGASDPQLWAAAGPDGNQPAAGAGTAGPTVLRFVDGTWTQVVPNLVSLPGDDSPLESGNFTPTPQSIAAEPGTPAAWIAVQSISNPDQNAHVDRVAIAGDGTASLTDQDTLGGPQGVGPKGPATAISCPAAQDCWLATSQGWLFHLTDGTQLPQDTDPNFQSVITFRPADNGVPAVITDTGIDNSPTPPPPTTTPPTTKPPHTKRSHKPLIRGKIRTRLVHRTVLEFTFTLTARAHVRVIGKRHGKVVAQTPNRTLAAGKRTLSLRLDPHRWPTGLSIKATALGGGGTGGVDGAGGGTVST
jgi:hypothetical protein